MQTYINYYGAYALYRKEVLRFLKVYNQTIIAPSISALTFFAVFILAMGNVKSNISGVSFRDFIAYGLIIMSIVQNAFANTSSSLIMSKVLGYISDILIPPLSSNDIIFAYIAASITRGLMVGVTVTAVLFPFINISVYSFPMLFLSIFLACLLLGILGMISGVLSNSFDQNAAINSYLVTPMSFLSGTFYSIHNLPPTLKAISEYNPFFYMIDLFRYSLTGYSDSHNLNFGIMFLIASIIVSFAVVKLIFYTGWRIKT